MSNFACNVHPTPLCYLTIMQHMPTVSAVIELTDGLWFSAEREGYRDHFKLTSLSITLNILHPLAAEQALATIWSELEPELRMDEIKANPLARSFCSFHARNWPVKLGDYQVEGLRASISYNIPIRYDL